MHTFSASPISLITLLYITITAGASAYSFQNKFITGPSGDHATVGRSCGPLARSHGGEDILSGSYDGTTFTIPLIKDNFPGMCSFPFGIHYGESSRYVWVYTHNRGTDGTTLIDVTTGKGVIGAYGHGSDVSPDGKRIAYTINGHYGLFHKTCVQDYAVYPSSYHISSNIDGLRRRVTDPVTPQMQIRHHPEWIDNDTICFVHYDHPRIADLLRDPTIKTHWFVQIDGVGPDLTSETIRAYRTKLNSAELKLLDEVLDERRKNPSNDNIWPFMKLAQACKLRLKPVTSDSFSANPLDQNHFPLLPSNIQRKTKSPDGKHTLTVSTAGEDTDTTPWWTFTLTNNLWT